MQYLLFRRAFRWRGERIRYEVFATGPVKSETFKSWEISCERAEYHKAHPWRTINLVAKMCRLNRWLSRWEVNGLKFSQAEVMNELKLLKCEQEKITPYEDFDEWDEFGSVAA